MLKIMFFLWFLILICFMKKKFWMVQNLLFLGFLLMLMMNYSNKMFSMSMFFGLDLMSFGLILLSFWICALMILSSNTIFF